MRTPAPLPRHLLGRPFRTADSGLGDRRLRAPDVQHPFRGVALVGDRPDSPRRRCEAYAPRLLRGQVFSHTTALQLWKAPVPAAVALEIHVSVEFPRTPPRTAGAIGHSLRRVEPTLVDDLPVSAPTAAWCQAAACLSVADLIAAGDSLVTGRRDHGVRGPAACSVEELQEALRVRGRIPGVDRARRALPWIRSGVDSAAETAMRLLLVRAGLPEPEVDVPIRAGGRIFHADAAYSRSRIALEYEGDHHRTSRAQWMHDLRRRELMADAGWRVMRVVGDDLDDPGPLLARLRRLLAVT